MDAMTKTNLTQLDTRRGFYAALLSLLVIAVSDFRLIGVYMLFAISIGFMLLQFSSIKIPGSSFSVVAFASSYFLCSIPHDSLMTAAKILVCPLLWIMGYNLPHSRNMQSILRVISVLAFGMAVHGLANYIYNLSIGVVFSTGVTYDFWSKAQSGATGQALNFTLFLSLLPWLVMMQPGKWKRMFFALMFLCATMYGIQLGSRTYVIMCGLVGIVTLVSLIQKKQRKAVLVILFALLALGAVFGVMYLRNVGGLRDLFESSYLAYRMERNTDLFASMLNNDRIRLKKVYLQNLFNYPWGGNHLLKIYENYAHELWLDIFDDAGLLPLVAVAFYSLTALRRLNKVRKHVCLTVEERVTILCYTVVIFAQFFVEPIWQGVPILLCCFVLIDGMIAKFLVSQHMDGYAIEKRMPKGNREKA